MSKPRPQQEYVPISEVVKIAYSKWKWRQLADQGIVRSKQDGPGAHRVFHLADCQDYMESKARQAKAAKPRNLLAFDLDTEHKEFVARARAKQAGVR